MVIIVACLLIMGSFLLVAMNVQDLFEEAERRNEVIAFVDEALSEEDARGLELHILNDPNVAQVSFTTREEAFDRFREDHFDRTDGLTAEVLRHRFVIVLEDIAMMEETSWRIEQMWGIDDVLADTQIAEWFVTVRNIITGVFIAIVAVLLVISVFIIANTIKLATFDRREEIAIMRMVGAKNWFIRWPFIFQGFILGLTGATIAFGLQWLVYGVISDQIISLSGGQLIQVIPFYGIVDLMILIFMGTGFVVGTLGSAITIRNYLKV